MNAAWAAAIAAFLLVVMFVLPLAGNAWTKTFTTAAISAVVAASLGILYGRVGMISLGQIGMLVIMVCYTATGLYLLKGGG